MIKIVLQIVTHYFMTNIININNNKMWLLTKQGQKLYSKSITDKYKCIHPETWVDDTGGSKAGKECWWVNLKVITKCLNDIKITYNVWTPSKALLIRKKMSVDCGIQESFVVFSLHEDPN